MALFFITSKGGIPVERFTNEPKETRAIITSVSESNGQTHIVFRSLPDQNPKEKLSFSISGSRPDWAVVGKFLKFQTER